MGTDAPVVPGAAGDDPAAALATGNPARSAADGALPSAHARSAAIRHADAQPLHKPDAREPEPAEATPPATPQPATVDLAMAIGPRPLREGERREPDGSPVGTLHGHDRAAQATGGALTSYALTEPEPGAATTEVAERLRYWISAGVQNAELQVDAFGGGTVEVSLSVQGNEARVEFRSDQPEARRLLQDAMPQLRSMLQDEGMVLSGGFVGTSAQGGGDPQGRRRTDRPSTQATMPVAVAERPSASASAGARRASATGSRLDVFV